MSSSLESSLLQRNENDMNTNNTINPAKNSIQEKKNTPRFLDYRRNPLPLDVALSFALSGDCVGKGRTARELILSKTVQVNNVLETSCHRLVCRHSDTITVDGVELERPIPMPKYFICYKPRGVICSNKRNEGIDRSDAVYISDWLCEAFRRQGVPIDTRMKTINTVGRLDEESEGLLLLTNDGSFSRILCDPAFGLAKTYRVVAKGSGYNRLKLSCVNNTPAGKINEIVRSANPPEIIESLSKSQIFYESCNILDVGKLPSQHASDDSYYALLDITLREGKTHAVRKIIKNCGMCVYYLSRIEVEGIDKFSVAKPKTLLEADVNELIPVPKLCKAAEDGSLVIEHANRSSIILQSGDIIELNPSDIDKIFNLRTC